MSSTVPPAFSIFSLAEAENACALTTSFLVSSPSPRIFTASIERGTMPGAVQRGDVDRARVEPLVERRPR